MTDFSDPPRPPEAETTRPPSGYGTAQPGAGSGAMPPPPPPPPAGPWSAPARPTPPPRPRSSLLTVLSVLIALFLFFIVVVGGGLMFLMHKLAGNTDAMGGNLSFGRAKIGLVRIEGEISPGSDTNFWLKALREMGRSDSIKGIVLRVNSPGGSVGASQELQSMVLDVRRRYGKPVYVSMGDLAASGGYYISSGAERIFALKGTLTGSIGVIMSKPDVSQLAEKLGITMENIKTGRFKDAGEMTRSLTPAEREMFDTLIMNTYDQFLKDILSQREDRIDQARKSIDPEEWRKFGFELSGTPGEVSSHDYLAAIADGRAFTGEQGVELGLVDQIGTLDDTIRAMGERLGISGWPQVQEATRQPSLRELLSTRIGFFLPRGESPLQYRMSEP